MTELKPNEDAILMDLVQAAHRSLGDARLLNMDVEISASKFRGRWGVQLTMTEVDDVKKM